MGRRRTADKAQNRSAVALGAAVVRTATTSECKKINTAGNTLPAVLLSKKMCPQDTMNLDGSARLTIRVTFAQNGPPLAALLLPLVQLVLGREVERDDFFAGV